jgi:hypothetical protein
MLIYKDFLFALLFILKQLIPPLTDEKNKRVSDTLSPGKSYIVSLYKNETVRYNDIDGL